MVRFHEVYEGLSVFIVERKDEENAFKPKRAKIEGVSLFGLCMADMSRILHPSEVFLSIAECEEVCAVFNRM